MKFIFSILTSLLLATCVGIGVSEASMTAEGVKLLSSSEATAIAFIGRTVGLKLINLQQGAFLGAGVNKEIWLDQILDNFYRKGDFLDGVDDWSDFVEFNTLNFAEAGGDPTVLVNNTTYPIATAQRPDTALTIALDTYDTENTRIRNIEEMEAAYNKRESVIRQHRNALRQECMDRAAHAFGPSGNSDDTPVILTTGGDTSIKNLTGTFKQFSIDDIANMKLAFDEQDFPEDRVLVLHPVHQNGLIKEDKSLEKLFVQLASGDVIDLYGFKIKKYNKTPVYTEGTLAKKAYGAVAAATTDTISSIAFCESEVMKAVGDVEMFWKNKQINTEQRADEIGFQKRFVALPKRSKAIGAILSDRN